MFSNGISGTAVQQLTRFQLTMHVAQSLCDSWTSCIVVMWRTIMCFSLAVFRSCDICWNQLSHTCHLNITVTRVTVDYWAMVCLFVELDFPWLLSVPHFICCIVATLVWFKNCSFYHFLQTFLKHEINFLVNFLCKSFSKPATWTEKCCAFLSISS